VPPPVQTVAIECIRSHDVLRVREAVARETSPRLGNYDFQDKDPSCAGHYLLYVNYDSGKQCVLALDKLRLFFHDHMPDCGLSLNRKIDLPYFAVWVGVIPMCANPARNTTFANLLITRVRNERKFSFTVDEAIKVSSMRNLACTKDREVSSLHFAVLGAGQILTSLTRFSRVCQTLLCSAETFSLRPRDKAIPPDRSPGSSRTEEAEPHRHF
jgi:hypothetical protein